MNRNLPEAQPRGTEGARNITGLSADDAQFLRADRDRRARAGRLAADEVRESPDVLKLLAMADEYEERRLKAAGEAQKVIGPIERNYVPFNRAAGNAIVYDLEVTLGGLRRLCHASNHQQIRDYIANLDDSRLSSPFGSVMRRLRSEVDSLGQLPGVIYDEVEKLQALLAEYIQRLRGGRAVGGQQAIAGERPKEAPEAPYSTTR